MAFQVDIISREIIKPSSSTPNHLNIYKLSLLEQMVAPLHVPLVLLYRSTNNDNLVEHLMRSLSKTLTQFYQLAGRIDGNDFITCNDKGMDFFKARANVQLSQLLINPKYDELKELLPITDKFHGLGPKVLLSIQANIFDCGGIAIGVCISHSICDASSISLFLNSWAANANANANAKGNIGQPIFDMTPYFPPKEDVTPRLWTRASPTKKMITKRFVFNECNIAALKCKCSSNSYIEKPSRLESIIAFLWKCGMDVVLDDDMISKPLKSVASISMDLRRRMNPPLSNLYVGSLVVGAMPSIDMATTTIENYPAELLLPSLVSQIRKDFRKFDSNYVRKIQFENGYLELNNTAKEAEELRAKKKHLFIKFSSWCRFPLYETDFGWGKPALVSPVFQGGEYVIILLDTKCGKGVEAWVTLVEEEMDIFEHHFISNLKKM